MNLHLSDQIQKGLWIQLKKAAIALLVIFFVGNITHAQLNVTLGSGSGTTSYFPNYYLYDYSYTQTIYPASELNAAGAPGASNITKIRYKPTASVSTSDWKDWVIYMANVTQDGFSSTSAYVSPTSMTQVFSGQIPANTTAGSWMEITLNTPFLWNGSDNLLVAIDENTAGWGGSPSWAGYTSTPATSGNSRGIYFYQDATNINPTSPSANSSGTYNNVAQVQFVMTSSTPCTGTPTAGTPPASFGKCLYDPFNIGMTGTTFAGGMTYQWQQRDPAGTGTWTDMIGFNSSFLNFPGGVFANDMDFRLIATCTASNSSDTSGLVTVTLNPPATCYCVPTTQYTSYYMNGVSTSGATQDITYTQSGFPTGGYVDSSIAVQNFSSNPTQTFNITTGFSLNTTTMSSLNIWVDWGQDGFFDNSDLIISDFKSLGGSQTYTITVPANINVGDYKMRVRYGYSQNPLSACGQTNYGSTVDFKLHIGLPPSCPAPTNLAAQNITDTTANLTWQENGSATQWQVEYGTFGSIPGAGTSVLTSTNPYSIVLTPNTNYEFRVRAICGVGDTSQWSAVKSFGNAYCVPTTSYTGDYVSGVTTNGAITNLNYSASSYTGSYVDQTSQTLTAFVTQAFTGSVSYVGGSNTVDVWVDWNHDYTFDNLTERILDTYGTSPQTLNFLIPAGTPIGTYRMRIRGKYSSGSTTPCGNENYGTAIDFMLNVINQPTCMPVTNVSTDSISYDAALISWHKGGTETSWIVEWGVPGFTPGTSTSINSVTVSDTSYLLTLLASDSIYNVYVRADCGGGDLSYWAGISIRTSCVPAAALDFCESFDVVADLSCWSQLDANNDANVWAIYLNEGVNGSNAAGIEAFFVNNDDYLFSAPMTFTGNEVLKFKYKSNDLSGYDTYNIEVYAFSQTSLDPSTVIDTLASFSFSNFTYKDTILNLSNLVGTKYIAFHAVGGSNNISYMFIEDVCFNVCVPIPGIDGATTVCGGAGNVNLNNIITNQYTVGTWHMTIPSTQGAINGSTLDPSVLIPGTYTANYVVQGGCSSDTTLATITIDRPSSAGIGTTLNGICKNQPISLYNALTGNVDLGGQWLDFQQNPITGSNTTAPSIGGQYNYFYIVSNGICAPDTAVIVVNVDQSCDWLSTSDVKLNNLSVYPNPATKTLSIDNPSLLNGLKAEIFDINGRLVKVIREKLNAQTTTISIDGLEKGMYTLRISNDEGQRIFKIIKE